MVNLSPKRLRGLVVNIIFVLMIGSSTFSLAQVTVQQAIIKVACIGNSITYGNGIRDREHFSYPSQLRRMLGKEWEVKNFGSSGRTLLRKGDYPYWNEKEFADAKNFNPDIVIIKLGTNDSKPWNWKHRDEFARDYSDFIGEFRKLPSHPKIFICTPVPAFPGDWGITDSVIRGEVIPLVRSIAEQNNVEVIDLYRALTGKPEYFPDKVHPNELGSRFMAAEIYKHLCPNCSPVLPPEPLEPLPSQRQLAWQSLEYEAFIHFNMNTFTDKEWGYGDESPSLFDPSGFDADTIVRTLSDAGMKGLVLTCKHHDGFCLWQSQYTQHSVKNSPWKNGSGDIVKEFSDACRRYGMKFGVYLSPWDRNHKDYGHSEYITYYRNQLRELLTNYGKISEVWFDGANGGDGYYGGSRETRTIDRTTYYGWNETWELVRQLQPDAAIFSDVGPDIRWIGNENGIAGSTCWSTYTPVGEKGDDPAPGYTRYSDGVEGNENGKFWIPAECDVSIRPGWFYHANEDSLVKTPEQLFDLYLQSVGHNASLLLNVPLDRKGQISSADEMSLRGLKKFWVQTFTDNIALKAKITASSFRGNETRFSPINTLDDDYETYWTTEDSVTTGSLSIDLASPQECNCILLREYIPMGQRVEQFSVDAFLGDHWQTIAEATTIGFNRILEFPTIKPSKIRITILQSKACPVISTIGIYHSPQFQSESK